MNNFRMSVSGASRTNAGSNIPRPTSTAQSSSNNNNNNNNSNRNNNNNNNGQLQFPLIKYESMIVCLADVRVPCTLEELQRPSPQKILQVYEAILEVATGSTTDNCVLEDFQEMNDELSITAPAEFLLDGARFYIFLNQIVKMMSRLGIVDFTSRDLTKPEADRVRRVLSAVINFIKFREVYQAPFWQEYEKLDDMAAVMADYQAEAKMLTEELDAIEQRRIEQEPRIEEVKTLNEQYAAEVGEHKRVEIELTRSKSEVANERALIAERLRELNTLIEKNRQELNQLRAQRVDVPETLEEDLVALPQAIQALVQQVDQQRKLVQARFAAVERIESIPRELRQVLDMLEDTAQLLERWEEELIQVQNRKSLIERKRMMAANVQAKKEQSDRQASRVEENLRKVLTAAQEKKEQLDKAQQEQDQEFREAEEALLASRQRAEEKKRKLQESWQSEEKSAAEVTAEMDRLKRLAEMYMTEMGQALRSVASE
ncbi:kinetochore-associated Ndc80 complex subunit nuf2 [Podila verticillata]|nr:kinetochore-associated Ndc80 complex subunit nuf2 [Haplosporangium bisporale]KAF9385967.1 kinetochore-associated Ndc80 complex subunit nuf2 [Podila verticillata]